MGKYCRTGESTDGNTIRHLRIACWIAKTINKRIEYVILIAFPQQQWLHERTPVLRYTYTASHVGTIICYVYESKAGSVVVEGEWL